VKAAKIVTQRLVLEVLNAHAVTQTYVDWLTDIAVNQYLESRFETHTVASVKAYVEAVLHSADSLLLGVFVAETQLHIGNVKIGPLNRLHQVAEIGIMIGDKRYWGQGLATEAICAVSAFAFQDLGMRKLEAGCYVENQASRSVFLKSGYQIEGRLRAKWCVQGQRQDGIRLGLLPTELPILNDHVGRACKTG